MRVRQQRREVPEEEPPAAAPRTPVPLSNRAIQRAFDLATSGSAGPVPHREHMEARFGRDFGHVMAYAGGSATRHGLDALGAVAAAYGNQVVFADAQPSAQVVAHELTHVVQHEGVDLPARPAGVSAPGDAAERLTSGPAPPLVHRLVRTAGGSWRTESYGPTREDDRVGAEIELHFTANDLVEAARIGLTQTVRTFKSSRRGGPLDTEDGARTQRTYLERDEGEHGRGIDRRDYARDGSLPNTNPLYGVYNVPAGGGNPAQVSTALGDMESTRGANETGSHRRRRDGTFEEPVDAVLDDSPGRLLDFPGQAYAMSFETTALALDGPLADTYLGSVAWGWRCGPDGKPRVDPAKITVVRQGPPTEAFGDAATKWNGLTFTDESTDVEYDTVDLPVVPDIGAMSTRNLADRLVALRREVAALPPGNARVRRDFHRVVHERELGTRNIIITVHVRGTEDWLGADHVYARLTGDKKHRTEAKKLNDGDSHDFLVQFQQVSAALPVRSPLRVEIFDEDTPDRDDKIVSMEWEPAQGTIRNKSSLDGAKYDVLIGQQR